MPAYSTIKSFVEALSKGETNITKKLEKVANSQKVRDKHGADLRDPSLASGNRFPDWLRDLLATAELSEEEIVHMECWPPSEKEVVRAMILSAIQQEQDIHFGWELHADDEPKSQTRYESNGEARIVFLSPRKGIEVSTFTFGDVKVKR